MPMHSAEAAAEGMPKKVDLDSVHSDVWHLFHLLDTIQDMIMEMPFDREGKRDHELDRVSALTWIARDRAESIGRDIDANYSSMRPAVAA